MKTTTNIMTCIKGLIGVASITIALPLAAIENPAAQDLPKQKENKGVAADEAPKENQKAIKKMAMLGVGGSPASETLSLHLGLEDGRGLTLFHVIPGSAAAKAGLAEHDVLTEFDGKKMGSQKDLRDAVSVKQPGDEVTIKFIHKGKAEEKKLVLGERADIPQAAHRGGINPWLRGMGNLPEADAQRMQQQMEKHFEQLRKQLEQNGGVQMDIQGLLQGNQQAEPNGKDGQQRKNFNFQAGTSITMMDDQGSVTVKTIDGKKEVIVKDKAGEVIFEGPYQTEQDKAAVPDDIRERLQRLSFGDDMKNGLRLQILPGGVMPPPADPDEDEAAE